MKHVILPPGGLNKGIDAMLKRAGLLKPCLRTIGEIQVTSTGRTFAYGGIPKWKKSARSKRDGGKPLSDTGRLRRSINYRLVSDGVIVGTNVVYAPTMHFGAKKGAFGTKPANVKAHDRTGSGKSVWIKEHSRKTKSGKSVTVKAHKRTGSGQSFRVKAFTRKQTTPWGTIPARPFLVLREKSKKEMMSTIAKYVLKAQ